MGEGNMASVASVSALSPGYFGLASGVMSLVMQVAKRIFPMLGIVFAGATLWVFVAKRCEQKQTNPTVVSTPPPPVEVSTPPPPVEVSAPPPPVEVSSLPIHFVEIPEVRVREAVPSSDPFFVATPDQTKIRALMETIRSTNIVALWNQEDELKAEGADIRSRVNPLLYLRELYLWNQTVPQGMHTILTYIFPFQGEVKASRLIKELVDHLEQFKQQDSGQFELCLDQLFIETGLDVKLKEKFNFSRKTKQEKKSQIRAVLDALFPAPVELKRTILRRNSSRV